MEVLLFFFSLSMHSADEESFFPVEKNRCCRHKGAAAAAAAGDWSRAKNKTSGRGISCSMVFHKVSVYIY